MFTYFNAFISGLNSRNEILIQPATLVDLPDLARIHNEGFARGWSDGELEKMVNNENYSCLVAHFSRYSSKRPSGFVLIRTIKDEAEIITIATRSSARRRGLASELMRAAIRQLEFDRAKSLFLEVDEANEAAVSLYRRFGFKKIGEREGYYAASGDVGHKKSTALVMQLELG